MTSTVIDVVAPGVPVTIGPPDAGIPGVVLAVMIEGEPPGVVSYRVAWWEGRQRKAEWVAAAEVQAQPGAESRRIGFHLNGLHDIPESKGIAPS